MAEHILPGFLDVAVPIEMQRMAEYSNGALLAIAQDSRRAIAENGDIIQFRAAGTAKATAALIRALAAAALLAEGGINFAGHHWCRDHAVCQAAAS